MSKRKKQVCVIGLGHFGWELALALAQTCEVLALDRDQELVNAISDRVHFARTLDIRDEATLASVIPEGLDEAVVSMGESMEGSILCTLYLKRLGVPMVRVKALTDDHAIVLRQVGADEVIFPERETARRVAAHVSNPNLLDFVPLGGDYQVVEVKPPSAFYGCTLADLRLRARFGVFVMAIRHGEPESMEFLPGPDSRARAGDVLVMIGREGDLLRLQRAGDQEVAPG
ncbi:MAG: TrkA family potassium uptake protein [Thermoleophilia bacterium]|nr:TrkA family potassium uptake protein [Thermoleophilia bacterium]